MKVAVRALGFIDIWRNRSSLVIDLELCLPQINHNPAMICLRLHYPTAPKAL